MTPTSLACEHCADRKGRAYGHDITMAFQPIFDLETGDVFAQEALLRGADGRGAGEMLGITLVQGYLLGRPQFEALKTRADVPL